MKSPFYFIVRPQDSKRYSNTRQIAGVDVVVSTSEEDHKFSNRIAEVIELPKGYEGPIKPGHLLIVHHNAFKFYNDMKGNRRSGRSFLRDDLFFVDDEQFFMYHDGSTWNAVGRFCFVKPVPATESYIDKPFTYEPLMGMMIYPNDYLRSQGISRGDIVCFTPESEYEFEVDKQTMYRVFDHQITMKL
jgi:hypothetical protein